MKSIDIKLGIWYKCTVYRRRARSKIIKFNGEDNGFFHSNLYAELDGCLEVYRVGTWYHEDILTATPIDDDFIIKLLDTGDKSNIIIALEIYKKYERGEIKL